MARARKGVHAITLVEMDARAKINYPHFKLTQLITPQARKFI